MSAEPQPASEVVCEPLEKMEDVSVGMRVEAKDSYGKWYVYVHVYLCIIYNYTVVIYMYMYIHVHYNHNQ